MRIKNIRSVIMIIGAILILANAIWITMQGKAIIISSYQVASADELYGNWWRIAFGIPSAIGSEKTVYFWLLLSAINLILALMFNFRREIEGPIAQAIMILSLVSLVVGGGFIIGMILTIIASASVIEDKPLGETFLVRILRAARMDPKLYEKMSSSIEGLKNAALTIVFLNVLSGLGNSLYIISTDRILDATLKDAATEILVRGNVSFDVAILGTIGTYIGIAVAKWLIFSAIIYFCLTRMAGGTIGFETIAQVVAFAYAPIALQLFMPLVFFNQPMLTGTWPLAFFFITNFWLGIALIFSIKKVADINLSKAFGITILGSAIYYAINYAFIEPSFPTLGIWFVFQPVILIEAMLSAGVLLGLAFGAFTKHR
jgi:hypothetical protein